MVGRRRSIRGIELIAPRPAGSCLDLRASAHRINREDQRMSRKFHKIRRLYAPSLLVKPARYAAGDMDPIAGPSAEQAGEAFADENWRDDSGAPQARQPKRRHIGAVSAIVGAAFDAATSIGRSQVPQQTGACTDDARAVSKPGQAGQLFVGNFCGSLQALHARRLRKVRGTGSPKSQPTSRSRRIWPSFPRTSGARAPLSASRASRQRNSAGLDQRRQRAIQKRTRSLLRQGFANRNQSAKTSAISRSTKASKRSNPLGR
jgi:hypothetical protein